MSKEGKVSAEVALQEVKNFLKVHLKKEFRRGKLTDEKIKEDYIAVIEAVEDGNLVFKDNKPEYTFYSALYEFTEDGKPGANPIRSVTFRSRIKGADRFMLIDGLDPQKQGGTYLIKVISYMCQLNIADVRQIEKDDLEVLNQICSVF